MGIIDTNVLVILTDQLRADCLGVAGHPDVTTPHLDALAADGIWYPHSYCTAPLCTPSRYSLLTGYQPHQHGIQGNNQGLAADLWTLPERARAHGCRTLAIGKMHLTPTYMDTGFDTMCLAEQNGDGRLVDDYHGDLLAAGLVDGMDLIDQRSEHRRWANEAYWSGFGAATSDLPERWHSTTWIAERGIQHIDPRWSDGGQLMYLSFIKPHHPFDPPEPWDKTYDPAALTLLPGWTPAPVPADSAVRHFDDRALTEDVLRRVMALYYGSISQIDFQIGRVVQRLQEVGAYQNTMIIFTADHGEYLGYHHLLLKGGPMYEPLIRVPLIVKPAGRPPQRQDDRLVSGIDVVPTALAALGLPVPDDLPGVDLLSDWRRDAVVAESRVHDFMVRKGRHKLLTGPEHESLYDLEADPNEMSPRELLGSATGERPAVAESMVAELRSVLDRSPQRRPGRGKERGSVVQTARPVDADSATRLAQFEDLIAAGHPWLDEKRRLEHQW